jgi:Zn-dependent protease with chaperone function
VRGTVADVAGAGITSIAGLDRRRGWARVRAVVACLVGIAVFALTGAALVMIVLAAAARFWSWATDTSFLDSPVWEWAPGGVAALGGAIIVISVLGAFWYFWWGASPQVLEEVGAHRLSDGEDQVVRNVVEALSIGIGKQPPTIFVTDDSVANALSLRGRRGRWLVVTSGCDGLPRDELEALCAHEFGHLWAHDAHWVTSGMVALARAQRFGGAIAGLGALLFTLVAAAAYYLEVVLWSAGLTALALLGLSIVAKFVLRRLELRIRSDADEIADVVAIKLARNPESLGAVCARLAADSGAVTPIGVRSELMWFERADGRDELLERAVKAYETAGVPLPPSVGGVSNTA